jgi:hypothetical protein
MRTPALPRIFFRGAVEANVPTGNNQYPPPLVDIPGAGLNPVVQADDAAVRRSLMNADASGQYGQGGWNYFGDNGFTFRGTKVTGVQWADGTVAHRPEEDALIGQDVDLLGHTSPTATRRTAPVTVDVDPLSDWASFVLADVFRIGTAKGTALAASGLSMGTMRWVSMQRNLYLSGEGAEGALMQFVATRDDARGIELAGADSPALAQLAACLAPGGGADGISILLALYNFNLDVKPALVLQAAFAEGRYLTNPAKGFMVGTVQAWSRDQPTQIPLGRYLGPTGVALDARKGAKAVLPGLALVQPGTRPGFVTVNLMNTVPEVDETQTKVDPGALFLEWVPDEGGLPLRVNPEPLPTDRESYEATSGLIDLPTRLDVRWSEGRFRIVGPGASPSSTPRVLLDERDRIVTTEQWATYLDHGERKPIELRAYRRGEPDANATLTVRQYRLIPTSLPTKDLDLSACLVGPDDATVTPVVAHRTEVRTDERGCARLELRGDIPGTCLLRFWAEADPPTFNWVPAPMDFYANVRVLPLDDELANLPATWENVYTKVLRYYFLAYPAMSQYIPFNREDSVRAAAGAILERLSSKGWHRTTYMPVTREMSRGKRELLRRWCELQLADLRPPDR